MTIQIKLKNSVVQDSTPSTSDLPAVGEIALNANINSIGGFMRASDNSIVKIFGPGSLSTPTATTTVSGISELATNSETTTGTATNRVVTPAGLNAVTVAERTTSNNSYLAKAGGTLTGVLAATAGSNSAPAIHFGDSDSGIFGGTNTVSLSAGGTTRLTADTGVSVVGTLAVTGAITSTSDLTIAEKIIHSGDTNTFFSFPAADIAAVDTAGSERLRVDASGRLLIGTTTPRSPASNTSRVQLEGNSAASSSFSITRNSANNAGPNIILNKTRGTAVGADVVVNNGDTLGSIHWAGNDGTDSDNVAAIIRAVVDGTPGSNDMPGRLVFYTTADGANTATERLRISSAGNVGIGTTSPTALLHLQKSGVSQNLLALESDLGSNNNRTFTISSPTSDSATAPFRISTPNALQFRIDTSTALDIDASGNVGIGTSSPDGAALHVSQGAAVVKVETTTSGNSSRVIIKSPADSYAGIHFGDDSDEDAGRIRYYHSSNFMQFVTDTSERMRIVGSKIGIGTTSPDQTLHVHKASAGSASSDSNAVLTVENSTHCILQMLSPSDSSNRIMFGDPADSNRGEIQYNHSSDTMTFTTDGTESMRITSNHQLLIGTSGTRSPAGFTPQLQLEGTNVSTSSMSLTRNTNDGGGPSFIFNKTRGTSDGADVIVNSGDTLGVLQFVGNDGANSDSAAAWVYAQVDGTPGSDDMPGRLVFATTADGANSPTERMRLNSSGNLGIGTGSPAGKIHANSAANTATFLAEGEVDNPAYPAYGFSGQNNDNGSRGTGMYLPGDGQLAFATAETERLRIDANGNLDINNAAIMSSFGSDSNIDAIHHDDGDNCWIFNSDTTLKATTGTSKLRCAGVDFGDNNTHADILDEYEEGSWTPSLKFGGGTSGITYSHRSGSYTRVGRVVTVNFAFAISSKGSSTGHAEIHGIPFNAADLLSDTTVENNGNAAFWDNVAPNAYNIMFHTNTAHIEIKYIDGAEDKPPDMTNSNFENNTSMRGSLTYFV